MFPPLTHPARWTQGGVLHRGQCRSGQRETTCRHHPGEPREGGETARVDIHPLRLVRGRLARPARDLLPVTLLNSFKGLDEWEKLHGSSASKMSAVLFLTYTSLIGHRGAKLQQLMSFLSNPKKKKKEAAIVELRNTWSGCIVFDESHRAKHYHGNPDEDDSDNEEEAEKKRGNAKVTTQTALRVLELQPRSLWPRWCTALPRVSQECRTWGTCRV